MKSFENRCIVQLQLESPTLHIQNCCSWTVINNDNMRVFYFVVILSAIVKPTHLVHVSFTERKALDKDFTTCTLLTTFYCVDLVERVHVFRFMSVLSVDVLVDDSVSDQAVRIVIDEAARETARSRRNLTKLNRFEIVNVQKEGIYIYIYI